MKKKNFTLKQFFCVPCPTCAVPVGKRCLLLSGAKRSAPHANRKIAVEVIERKAACEGLTSSEKAFLESVSGLVFVLHFVQLLSNASEAW
jgi:hypothetical protein